MRGRSPGTCRCSLLAEAGALLRHSVDYYLSARPPRGRRSNLAKQGMAVAALYDSQESIVQLRDAQEAALVEAILEARQQQQQEQQQQQRGAE